MKNRYGAGRPARSKNTLPFKIVVGVLVFAVVIISAYYFFPRKSTDNSVTASVPVTYDQKQSTDVNTVGGAIGQYTAANAVLPIRLSANGSTLVMCNSVCDPTTSQISQLTVYLASAVEIKPYVSGMLVASKDSMLLVPGGACRDKTALGGPANKRNAMVILYATDSSTGLSQHCVTL